MNKNFEPYSQRKLLSSYLSVTISITLVLFLLGFLGLWILNTLSISNGFKEQVILSIELKNNAKTSEITHLQKQIESSSYCKSVVYISKEDAAKIFSEELGEDFESFIGNPLKNTLELKLKSNFVTPEQMKSIAEKINKNPIVVKVNFDSVMVEKIHYNIGKVSLIIFFISIVLTLVAVVLINASIRLSIYSKRFIIKTMQLVGATKNFIRFPFMKTYLYIGLISWVIASILLLLTLFQINNYLPDLQFFKLKEYIFGILASTLCIGIIIVGVSTYLATERFLNLNTDDLY